MATALRSHAAATKMASHQKIPRDATPGIFYMKREPFERFVECMTKPGEPTEWIKKASKLLRELAKVRS